MMSRVLLLMMISLGLSGCFDEGSRPAETSVEQSSNDLAIVRLSWEEQVAEVRAGKRTEVDVDQPVTAEQLSALAEGCEAIETLKFKVDAKTAAQLQPLAALPQLTHLVIDGPVDDAGMSIIANCPRLMILNLPAATFSQEGLRWLSDESGNEGNTASPPPVIQLRFSSPNVSDDGMTAIANMPKLRRLHLINVPITDNGLKALAAMATLESFYIDGGNCTDEGLSELLKQHPHLHLHVNQLHLPEDKHANHQH